MRYQCAGACGHRRPSLTLMRCGRLSGTRYAFNNEAPIILAHMFRQSFCELSMHCPVGHKFPTNLWVFPEITVFNSLPMTCCLENAGGHVENAWCAKSTLRCRPASFSHQSSHLRKARIHPSRRGGRQSITSSVCFEVWTSPSSRDSLISSQGHSFSRPQ